MNPIAGAHGKSPNSFGIGDLPNLPIPQRELIDRRLRVLSPAYRLFYKEPVELVRGKGTHLYDREGNEFLDVYNNVVPLGHSHPAVINAVHEQMSLLSTNTRYLHRGVVEYAEQLIATFDGALGSSGRATFTCSGSEANDLAIRMAKHYTGNLGIIVTTDAYHGATELAASFSPSLGAGAPLGPWVRCVPVPNRAGGNFLGSLQATISELDRHGVGVAALVMDPAFSSDGIFTEATGDLAVAVDVVHAAGGLFIADEVQAGFGRLGEYWWGHQRHGVVPDIVTLGKPMGNGFPIAGVVTRHDVVSDFGAKVRYFNTFGGNTVAIAAAQATLDTLKELQILDHVTTVGESLFQGLQDIANRHSEVTEIRGTGLFAGVQLTGTSPTPEARELTRSVVNELRRRHVLVSITGPDEDVIKIRPPLVFSEHDSSRFLSELDNALNAVRGA